MRTTTLTRALRVALILAGLAVLPQFASAQLTVLETKALKIQNTGGTFGTTLTATGVTANYTLNLPAGQGTAGGFLYLANTDGQLAFALTTGITTGSTPVWDGDEIIWENPNGANNPNWSLNGNNKASGSFTLGFTDGSSTADIAIKTANNVRIAIGSNGTVTIDETTNITGATTIVGATLINATGTATTGIGTSSDGGTVTIGRTGGTLTTIGSLGHTGASSFTGTMTLAGASSPLVANGGAGDAGNVLVSQGASTTPIWKSLNDATGIKVYGSQAFANENTKTVNVTGFKGGDIVLLTTTGSTGVIAQVTAVADGSFTIGTSAQFTGSVNYIVLDNTPTP